jgi:hypothetical protein
MSCITFLCQKHHDPELLEDEIQENVLYGTYVLHEYAATNWLGLVEKCVSLDRTKTATPDLVRSLNEIRIGRSNNTYVGEHRELDILTMDEFKGTQPALFQMLSEVAFFRELCLNSPRASDEGKSAKILGCSLSKPLTNSKFTVINLDPLTITQTSVLIEKETNDLLCRNQTIHGDNCYCDQIREYHGDRLFKCSFSHCHFRRQGFSHRGDLKSHEKYHDRPWKCDVSTCEYANGGFLSRKMRDEHFEKAHQVKTSNAVFPISQTHPDALLIDLVLNANADNVDNIKSAVQAANLGYYSKESMYAKIADRGSLYQLRLVHELFGVDDTYFPLAITSAIKTKNEECFEFLVKSYMESASYLRYSSLSIFLIDILHSDSIDICNIFEKYARKEVTLFTRKKRKRMLLGYYLQPQNLLATIGNLTREEKLLSLINGMCMTETIDKADLGSSLMSVAQSSCSVRLATLLVEAGANVDFRRSDKYITSLHHAARKTSVEAAELMKFLLQRGADPELTSGRSKRQIKDEEGAKGISKWLGVSWNELVEQTKKERDDMQAKQISSPH